MLRWENGQLVPASDDLAAEEPLEIRIDNHSISVTMRTPGNDEELAVGFLVSEGLIKSKQEVQKIEPHPRNAAKNVINVFLSPEVTVNFQQLTRHVFMSSSCGLCGKASIESVHQHFPPVSRRLNPISAGLISALPAKLRAVQETFSLTGGLHGAAIFDEKGNLLAAREDIGRHNAVDKIIGWGLLSGTLPFEQHVLLVSGRASFEIMQKALSARISVVCAVSAPSSLAVEFARESGQTLVAFLRDDRMNVYSHPEAIKFDEV
ncbi:MAG: formate dehydrogenase accessory sulfurtransferase FdhD [Verrucomicrobia bacterium]|nr:formate dehydrogenase accessory sulfurtransferase FdhD [Verrucomicrobiota bacterium]